MLLFVCVIDRVFDGGEGKKPRLTVDTSRDCQPLCEALSSNESFTSSFIGEREEGEGARAVAIDTVLSQRVTVTMATPGNQSPPPV